jgi:predicted nucleic acid-binding Zn ribbon protein
VSATATIWRTCPVCGASFEQPDDPGRKRVYCSRACQQAAYRARQRQRSDGAGQRHGGGQQRQANDDAWWRARERYQRGGQQRQQRAETGGDGAGQRQQWRQDQHEQRQPPPTGANGQRPGATSSSRPKVMCSACGGLRARHTVHHDQATHQRPAPPRRAAPQGRRHHLRPRGRRLPYQGRHPARQVRPLARANRPPRPGPAASRAGRVRDGSSHPTGNRQAERIVTRRAGRERISSSHRPLPERNGSSRRMRNGSSRGLRPERNGSSPACSERTIMRPAGRDNGSSHALVSGRVAGCPAELVEEGVRGEEGPPPPGLLAIGFPGHSRCWWAPMPPRQARMSSPPWSFVIRRTHSCLTGCRRSVSRPCRRRSGFSHHALCGNTYLQSRWL